MLNVKFTEPTYWRWTTEGLETVRIASIISCISLLLLLMLEQIKKVRFKNLSFTILAFYFAVPIVYFWEPGVLTNHFSIFIIASFFSLFFSGAVLAAIMLYSMEGSNNYSQRYVMVLFFIPLVLLFPIGFLIVILADFSGENTKSSELNFPFNYILGQFGEGSAGSFYIIIIIFSFYLGVKFFDPKIQSMFRIGKIRIWFQKKRNQWSSADRSSEISLKDISPNITSTEIRFKDYIIFTLELFTAFTSIAASFALSGLIISDGTPALEPISKGFVFFSFLTIIPFIILITRNSLFDFQQPRYISEKDLLINLK